MYVLLIKCKRTKSSTKEYGYEGERKSKTIARRDCKKADTSSTIMPKRDAARYNSARDVSYRGVWCGESERQREK